MILHLGGFPSRRAPAQPRFQSWALDTTAPTTSSTRVSVGDASRQAGGWVRDVDGSMGSMFDGLSLVDMCHERRRYDEGY